MMTIQGKTSARFGEQLLSELRDFKSLQNDTPKVADSSNKSSTPSFMEHLEQGITSVNENQKLADSAATDLATGKNQNIHETMLAVTQAELTFNMMVQVRNKALEAYQEIMRMPV